MNEMLKIKRLPAYQADLNPAARICNSWFARYEPHSLALER
jgi:hypothetical protein